jgi:hypothetical protein
MDEADVDDELGLPKELMNKDLTLRDKRELLQYKQTHNEVSELKQHGSCLPLIA